MNQVHGVNLSQLILFIPVSSQIDEDIPLLARSGPQTTSGTLQVTREKALCMYELLAWHLAN